MHNCSCAADAEDVTQDVFEKLMTILEKENLKKEKIKDLSKKEDVYKRQGYEFDENDAHDVKLLCETFHIEIPNEYR